MAKKLKVYGKKKGQDVAFKFGKLTLSSPSDQNTENARENRNVLSLTSINNILVEPRHEGESRESLDMQENRPVQAQDAPVQLAESSIQNDTDEACETSLARWSKTDKIRTKRVSDKFEFTAHTVSSPGMWGPNSSDELSKGAMFAGEETDSSRKERQREATDSEQQKAPMSRPGRSTNMRNATGDRKNLPWKSRLSFHETGKQKLEPVEMHRASEKSSTVQSKPQSPQSSSQANSSIAPPRTLRSTRRNRETPGPAPNGPAPVRELTLDPMTEEHLKPLTELEAVSRIVDIHLWHEEWITSCTFKKIAEGSYGSVFRMTDKKDPRQESIGKLMPLKSRSGVGSRKASYTAIMDATGEVKLLGLMSDVPGFVEFKEAQVLIGALPRALRDEYHTYAAKKNGDGWGTSRAETWFPSHQAWLFIEMADAGVELEEALMGAANGSGLLEVSMTGKRILTVRRMRDIFWGVLEALRLGEEIHGFEHRDLHLSNICVKVKQGQELESGYELIPLATNVDVTIIDYTISRAVMPDKSVIFNPMFDENIFQGDGTVDIQFAIYRHMRDLITKPHVPYEGWDAFVPITNVLWLSFVLGKLMQWTPRPVEVGEEQELWDSLENVKREIDLDCYWSWDLRSACDVKRYLQVGKKRILEEMKEKEERKEKEMRDAMVSLRRVRRGRIRTGDRTAG
ncbi:hypothetical protein MMC07_003779 [Pseudocyphellaria aurata]|nr:hypothetical protein [Pseudocyphellaria aurata]